MVAGEAYCKSATSNNILQNFYNLILSPLINVSNLLSSMTLFMFSTHTASTSPSYKIHLGSSLPPDFSLAILNVLERRPSVHYLVWKFIYPYNSVTVIDFGLIQYIVEPSTFFRISITDDFPLPVGPTTIVVCLVPIVSNNCTTLSIWLSSGNGCNPNESQTYLIFYFF